MRHFATSALLLVLIQSHANADLLRGRTAAVGNATAVGVVGEHDSQGFFVQRIAQNTGTETSNSVTAEPDTQSYSTNGTPELVARDTRLRVDCHRSCGAGVDDGH
jgi:hypothetical protein